jgi:hypothetical protein
MWGSQVEDWWQWIQATCPSDKQGQTSEDPTQAGQWPVTPDLSETGTQRSSLFWDDNTKHVSVLQCLPKFFFSSLLIFPFYFINSLVCLFLLMLTIRSPYLSMLALWF